MSPKQDAVLWVAISDALEELATDATPEQVTDWLGRHRPQVKLETWLKADRGGQAAIMAERRWWRWGEHTFPGGKPNTRATRCKVSSGFRRDGWF